MIRTVTSLPPLYKARLYAETLNAAGFDAEAEEVNFKLSRIKVAGGGCAIGNVTFHRTRTVPTVSFHEIKREYQEMVEEGCFGYKAKGRVSEKEGIEPDSVFDIFVSTSPCPDTATIQDEDAEAGIVIELGGRLAGRHGVYGAPPLVCEALGVGKALSRIAVAQPASIGVHASRILVHLIQDFQVGRVDLDSLSEIEYDALAELAHVEHFDDLNIHWKIANSEHRAVKFAEHLCSRVHR